MKSVKGESNKSNIIFFIIFGLLILGSVAFTYYRIMIQKDYLISAEAECDPTVEECFIWECDPESTEEGEACTGDEEEDIWYYKIIKRKAFNIPLCDPNDENCEALICSEGEKDCSYELCEEGNADEIECNDPVQYNIDNPEEEESECAEDDEECLAEEEAGEECEEGDEECLNAEEESACEEGDEECLAEEEASAGEEECDAETEDCAEDAVSEEAIDAETAE